MVKVAIYENGCAKEEATRRYFIDKLLESGNKLVSDPNEADYIIFQSCVGVYNTVEILTEELGQTINEQKSTGNEIILVGCFNKISG
jgi:tRNA A37 methylthiotransferase MiaB